MALSVRATTAIAVLLALLCVAAGARVQGDVRAASRSLQQTPEPLAPEGVWQAVRTVGRNSTTICGLRDFPPIGGEGETRMLCGGAITSISPYWVWKALKPDGNETLLTGEPFFLRIFNSMLTHCRTRSNLQLFCGVESTRATLFNVEKVGSPAPGQLVIFDTDSLYLKQGSRYCRVRGTGNSAYVFCDGTSAAQATVFQMPRRTYHPVSLVSSLSNQACGATFIPYDAAPVYVNCSNAAIIPSNRYTRFVASLRIPGTGFISGAAYAFMNFDALWHYQVAAWSAGTPEVQSINNDMRGDKFFFIVEKVGATFGTALANGDVVTLRSFTTNLYCGIASVTSGIVCNSPTVLGTGYTFRLGIN